MSAEVTTKEATPAAPSVPSMSFAERIMAKKLSSLSSPSNDKVSVTEKSDTLATVPTQSTRALAGLMMVKRRVGKWKQSNLKAGSAVGSGSMKNAMRMALENTYQLDPDEQEKFDVQKVKKVVEDSLRLFLIKQSAYNAAKSSQISRYISEDVKSRVKALAFKRYKVIVQVVVGQTKDQGLKYASRCVWNAETDNVATVVKQHKDMYVVVNVFGVYSE